jgi:hypothetical protein
VKERTRLNNCRASKMMVTISQLTLPVTPPVPTPPPPIPPPAHCLPSGATVLASSDTAILSLERPTPVTWSVVGCLLADGQERVLMQEGDPFVHVGQAAVAGNYAAFSTDSCKTDIIAVDQVWVFDLRTGEQVPDRGGEGTSYFPNTFYTSATCAGVGVDQLVLASDAVSAIHFNIRDPVNPPPSCTCTTEQIQASDSTGVNTLDSVTEPDGSPAALTNLTLTGDTLTWDHNGSPRSAQLQP